jgi:excisionase family DNA binding protein
MPISTCGPSHDLVGLATNQIPFRAAYSPKETERLLGVSHATLYRLIAAGRLDARKLGGKTLIIAASLEMLLASLPKVGGSV